MDVLNMIFGGVGAGLSYVANANQTKGGGEPSPSSQGIPVSHKLDMASMTPLLVIVAVMFFVFKRK
jgi:hypothetical protein